MRKEDHLPGRDVVKNPIIVTFESVAVPMAGHQLQRDEGEKTVHVEHALEALHSFEGIRFLSGDGEPFQV